MLASVDFFITNLSINITSFHIIFKSIEIILKIWYIKDNRNTVIKIRKEELKMLWMDYYFYLSKLPEEERRNQILLLIGFFIVLFIIGGIGEFIRHKFNKKK